MSEDDNSQDSTAEFWSGTIRSIEAAEDHIGAKRGLILGLLKEQDFIFMIGVYGVIEPIMNDILSNQFLTYGAKHKSFDQSQKGVKTFVRKQTYKAKADLLRSIGFIGDYDHEFITTVGEVRNRYGHNVRNISRSIADVAIELGAGGKSKIARLVGIGADYPKFDALLVSDLAKYLIMSRLASFLSEALHTIKPPVLPTHMGGLLGLGWGALSAREAAAAVSDETMTAILGSDWKSQQSDDERPSDIDPLRQSMRREHDLEPD